MDRLPPIHQKYALYKGVKPLRIDHFNCFSPNVDESVAFYNEIGFRVTEYTEDEETGRLWAAWTHRKGGVHDIAFTNGRGPRLHHTAFWVPTPLNIIDLLDLMATTGWLANIERGPGRHGISNAFFLYVRDPDGHRIEIYCSDYQTVDPDLEPIKWDLKDPQRQTLWGAPAPKSWFEEGSMFAGTPMCGSRISRPSRSSRRCRPRRPDRRAEPRHVSSEVHQLLPERVARLRPRGGAGRYRSVGPPRRALADLARGHRGRRPGRPWLTKPRACRRISQSTTSASKFRYRRPRK